MEQKMQNWQKIEIDIEMKAVKNTRQAGLNVGCVLTVILEK